MNPFSNWLCTSNTKNLFVRIVHPGGHVELHDRPILAAELLNRNPKCCVAHPTVFQQPYNLISPETTLTLGQKYYIVPLGTIRKLQNKCSSSNFRENQQANIQNQNDEKKDKESLCWSIVSPYSSARKAKKGKNGLKMKSSNSSESLEESEKKTVLSRKKKDSSGDENERPKLSLVSMDNWEPGLESVAEE